METLVAAQNFSRVLMNGIDTRRIHAVPGAGQSLFGAGWGNGGGTLFVPNSTVIEFDVRKGNRGISTFVHRGTLGKALNKPKHVAGKFTSIARTFPLLHDTGLVTSDQLLKRVYNEPVYQPFTKFERARRNASLILEDIVVDHIYAMEFSAWQMIKTGKMDLIYGTTSDDEIIDTKRLATHTFTVAASWATAATSILDSIDSVCTLGVEDAGGAYDVMVVGTSVPGYIASNTEIQAFANLKAAGTSGFELVYFGENNKVDSKYNYLVDNGYNPICRLRTKMGRTVNVFTYEGTYVLSGTTTYYVTAEEAVFFRSNAACDRQFGPAEKLDPTEQMQADWDEMFGFSPAAIDLPPHLATTPGVIVPETFVCDIQRNVNNTQYEISCQAAPLFVTRDTDSFAYIEDVTATA